MADSPINLRPLIKKRFDDAQNLWFAAIACRLLVIGASAFATFTNTFATEAAGLSGVLTIAFVALQWRSDKLRSSADALQRKFEMYDGLGWATTSRELSDLL